ncbi:hypothetical protein HUT19_27005 [Streptomyces sp. NA02950]|uniref:hypothetical protein n=1 Tax=Streptomyces sp. NA02950 TaxID=2742137 RepID=UPI001590C375|nr:hypothetical protein [Streptomyces sp. NA02950]QKV94944.1 hypothetical protein HUT19_27005 [Streptomyces sp. NA02950]
MSHPPTTGRAAPPAPAAPPRTAWREGVDRARAAATTEPGRLRVIGAVLAVLVVAFGAVTAWQVADRQTAADAVADRSQPLSADAARIYRSLADADTTAASGFLAGKEEPAEVRQRYETDIDTASRLLVRAAATTDGAASARHEIRTINRLLPVYTGLVESARANNRQGLPLGGAYLRYANDTMRGGLLPAASRLYQAETARLGEDYEDAKAWPWAALGAGVIALGALGWAQRRNYRRTNRVFNRGLLAATAASTVVLLWTVVGHAVARAGLSDSHEHGANSLRVLNAARIDALRARADENLTLVARGAVVIDKDGANKGKDAYEVSYGSRMKSLAGDLRGAREAADDSAGRDPVDSAASAVREWRQRHQDARGADDAGDYGKALKKVIGADDSTGQSFDTVDTLLAKAVDHEQREFQRAADDGRGAFTAMAAGAGVLAVLGAVGAVLGIGRRLSEYR